LGKIRIELPPIKGVLHCGLVIRNSLFQNMDMDAWRDSLRVKVQGTWNLHNQLPEDLDFFVLLSSMVGVVGNASQAAYGAASTFQDAFANFRRSLGRSAVTIDLGMVVGIGYVAERSDVENSLRTQGFEELNRDQCMAILEFSITQPCQSRDSAVIMTGVGLDNYASGQSTLAVYTSPRFSHFRRMALSRGMSESKGQSSSLVVRDLLKQATSFDEASQYIEHAVITKIANLLMVPADNVLPSKAMSDYGLDSLIAVVCFIEATLALPLIYSRK
jgi:hypothetical protein